MRERMTMGEEAGRAKQPNLIVAGLVSTAVLAGVGFLLAYLLRRDNLLRHLALPAAAWSWAFGGAAVAFALAVGLYVFWPALHQTTDRVAVRLVSTARAQAGWAGLVVTTLVPPLGEEALFRGALQPTLGLLLTSILFGLSHGGWRRDTWPYAVSAGFSGLIIGAVLLRTGSLAASALTHILFNAAVTLLMAQRWWPFAATESQLNG